MGNCEQASGEQSQAGSGEGRHRKNSPSGEDWLQALKRVRAHLCHSRKNTKVVLGVELGREMKTIYLIPIVGEVDWL